MKILFLCIYPIENPRHGGQLRARNIVDMYRSAGYEVEAIGVSGSEAYEKEEGFLPFPSIQVLNLITPNILCMEDYAIGRLFSEESKYYEKLKELIKSEPDVIHVEQPWLFGFALRYISDSKKNIKIIYGSQNIEWQLRQQIQSSFIDTEIVSKNVELIKKVELEAIASADAIIAVSESDADWICLKTQKTVVIAPNGVKQWSVTEKGRIEAKKITQNYDYALYCGSAHSPNMTGFFDMFSGGFGSLKPDEKLVIVGGAGVAIAGDIRVNQSPKLAEKILVAGVVSQSCLDGLLDGAKCIVLPLTQGGGTNLKTAEALWAGKHIVATSIAMRGFEQYINSNGVHLADDPVSFKRKVRDSMCAETLHLTEEQITERKAVLWENCLKPLMALMNNLNNGQ